MLCVLPFSWASLALATLATLEMVSIALVRRYAKTKREMDHHVFCFGSNIIFSFFDLQILTSVRIPLGMTVITMPHAPTLQDLTPALAQTDFMATA